MIHQATHIIKQLNLLLTAGLIIDGFLLKLIFSKPAGIFRLNGTDLTLAVFFMCPATGLLFNIRRFCLLNLTDQEYDKCHIRAV